jgi:hypothetical protein
MSKKSHVSGSSTFTLTEALELSRMSSAHPHLDRWTRVRISTHACRRFRSRVARMPHQRVRCRIQQVLHEGTWTNQPSDRYYPAVAAEEGVIYVESARLGGVVLLIRNGVVVTVYSARSCRSWAQRSQPPVTRMRLIAA